MGRAKNPTPPAMSEKEWRDCPDTWLFELVRARSLGDTKQEAVAQKHLKRLGVTIVFHAPEKPRLIRGGKAQ